MKILSAGLPVSEALRRFRDERRILASLEHPHIARLLDAGRTDDGLHYIVMELVEGVPITEHCRGRALDVPARVALLRTVASAVHFAHQRLVVHRDLKPANILVAADGQPRLLDFGIAKVLAPDSTRGDRAAAAPRLAGLRQPRAAARLAGDHFERRLCPGRRLLRAARRRPARPIEGRLGGPQHRRATRGGQHVDRRADRGAARGRSRRDRDEGDAAGAAGSLRVGRGARRRFRALPRSPARARAQRHGPVQAAALRRAASRRRGGGGHRAVRRPGGHRRRAVAGEHRPARAARGGGAVQRRAPAGSAR